MKLFEIETNSIFFTPQGQMYCGVLLSKQYTSIIIDSMALVTKDTIQSIYNKIKELYAMDVLDRKNLSFRFNYKNPDDSIKLNPIFELLEAEGFKFIEFVVDKLEPFSLLDSMVQKHKASLCLQLDYGSTLNNKAQKYLKTIIENTVDKESITVHYIIRNINNVKINCVNDFIKLMYKLGIITIGLKLDTKYLDSNLYCCFDDSIREIFLFFFKTAKKYSFLIDTKDKNQNNLLKRIFTKTSL